MSTEIFGVADACLVSLSASVAAGCVPCAGYYTDRARTAGVTDDDVRAAIDIGETIRRAATVDVTSRVRERAAMDFDAAPELSLHPGPARQEPAVMRREVLQYVAAAYAANSHALLSRLFGNAAERQVPADQVAEAIEIARGVRNMAIAIVDRIAEREAGVRPDRDAPPSCVCG